MDCKLKGTLKAVGRLSCAMSSSPIRGSLTIAGHVPVYRGRLDVTPLAKVETVLPVSGLQMPGDVVVREIPFFETSNESGGKTVIIGG